jgi:hypothetical protein
MYSRLVVVEAGFNCFFKLPAHFRGCTILHSAVWSHQVQAVLYVLKLIRNRYPERFEEFVNVGCSQGWTALENAISMAGIELGIVGVLCDVSDLTLLVNVGGLKNGSYLNYAVFHRRWTALETLLEFSFSNEQIVEAMRWCIVNRHRKGHGILKKEAKARGIALNRQIGVYK